jgi:hypothetical protein
MQSLGVGHVSKIYLEWQEPWWAAGEGGISLAWSDAEMRNRQLPRDWFQYISNFSEVEGQPKLLACLIAGSGARVADQLEDEEV